MLYGRERERQTFAELLTRARRGRSAALVLHGPPGVGKSALLDGFAADAAGVTVLRCTGIESEAELAFAALHWLLRPAAGLIDRLPGPQAEALRSAFGCGTAAGQDRFLTGLAVLSLLAEYAADGPLLCLVDDAHWLDQASLDALLFAARRLDAEGVVLVFAQRDEFPLPAGLATHPVGGLAPEAAAQLLDSSAPALTRHERGRVLAESGGNPLALQELPGSLAGSTALGTLPLPRRIQDAYGRRIAGLSADARRLLVIAAAEGTGDLAVTERAGAYLDLDDTALDEIERSDLVTVTGPVLTFRHPLVRAAAYHGETSGARRTAHGALAAVLDAADDADRRAWHRAEAAPGPDETIAAELEDTAERARARHGFAAAAAALERAGTLSRDPARRAARWTAAADAALQAGLRSRAGTLIDKAERLTDDPAAGAVLARLRAQVAAGNSALRQAHGILIAASGRIATLDPELNLAILVDSIRLAWFVGDLELLRRSADLLRAGPWPNDELRNRARGGLALEQLADGRHDLAQPVIRAMVDAARNPRTPLPNRINGAGIALVNGEFAAAREIAVAVVAQQRTLGTIGGLPATLQIRALADTFENHFQDAIAACDEGLRLEEDTGQAYYVAHLRAARALALAYCGDEEPCRELAGQALSAFAVDGAINGATVAHWALAVLDLGLGRYEPMLDRLEANAAGPARHQMDVIYSAPDQVEAAIRFGDPDRARTPLNRFTRWAAIVNLPWARAIEQRCLALVSEDDAAETHFRSALNLHTDSGRPFEYARTELLYAEWLRRNRRATEARVYLRTALDRFTHTGARPWAERARAELRAAGEATPTVATAADGIGSLTAQERQVVRLAAQGSSNRDIAAQLFISPRTVSHHLYRAFPKLGVTSRIELVRLAL
ncbi:helix-turn-helix transcriptional regulator [Nocardia stercoris]|uniref:Helix-turn-helix transcriptional regulator n=1 Tax=Nocardia stercoris TaxID=2483361 RepID=A0A3M2L409_9NOCA|nr:helix-turn-helix transcriptional regulator [Nocardia stercoris]